MLLKLFNISAAGFFYFYLSLFIFDYTSISNISGPTVGMLFFFILSRALNKKDPSKSYLLNTFQAIAKSNERNLVIFSAFTLFIVFASLSLARHFALSSSSWDLGIFDQAIWNAANGNMLVSSLKGNINLLGDHFEPVLFVFVPLYKVFSSAAVLLISQSLILSLAVFPLYLIAKDKLSSRPLVLAFIASFMLSRPLRGVVLSDFHPECFILLFSFWAYYFLIKKKNGLLLVSVLFMLACKEDVAFLVSALGLYMATFEKRRDLGVLLLVTGIVAWILETKFFIPAFNPARVYPYMDRLPFGTTYADNLKAVIHNPALLAKIFMNNAKISYCLKFLGPLAFLPLLSPRHYILIAVPLLRNILPIDPNFSGHYDITSHYTAAVIPFVYIAAIYGAANLAASLKQARAPLWIAVFILLTSLFYYGKTDAHKFRRFVTSIKENHTLEKIAYLKQIPADASVSTNFNLVPHLSERKYIYQWSPLLETSFTSEYLAIDMTLLDYMGKEDRAAIGAYLQEIGGFGYKLVFENPRKNFLIYKK